VNNETILRERCREALKLTKSHGADEVEIFAQTTHAISADIEKHGGRGQIWGAGSTIAFYR